MEAATRHGFDADHAHASGEPGGLSADEAATARRGDDRVERAGLLLQLPAHRALAGDDVRVVVGMHEQRAGLPRPQLARGLGVVVVALDDLHVGAERGDAVALHRRAGGRHEHLGPVTEAPGDVGDGRPVVTTGGGDEAGGGHVGAQHAVERAPRLEGACVLQQLQFQRHRHRQPQLTGVDRREPASPRRTGDPGGRGLDVGGGDEPCHGANLAESHRRHSPTSTCTPSSRCSTGRPGSTSWWPRRWPTASRRSGSPTTATCTARWSSTRSAGAKGSARSSAPRPTWPTSTAASGPPGVGASTTPAATPRAGRSSTTTSRCSPRPTPATATSSSSPAGRSWRATTTSRASTGSCSPATARG